MSESPSTDDIILDRAIQGTDCRRCVDWAIGMLMSGHDADYLCRLAGQLPPFDLDTITGLRDRALAELGFHDLLDDALLCHTVANALRQHRGDELRTEKTLESARWLYARFGAHGFFAMAGLCIAALPAILTLRRALPPASH